MILTLLLSASLAQSAVPPPAFPAPWVPSATDFADRAAKVEKFSFESLSLRTRYPVRVPPWLKGKRLESGWIVPGPPYSVCLGIGNVSTRRYGDKSIVQAFKKASAAVRRVCPSTKLMNLLDYLPMDESVFVLVGGTQSPKTSPTATARTTGSGKADQLHRAANELLRQQKVTLAIDRFKACLGAQEDHCGCLQGLGAAYFILGRKRSTVEMYRRFVSACPSHPDVGEAQNVIRTLERGP